MFGLLTIDEGASLSMTAGCAVAQLLLVWSDMVPDGLRIYMVLDSPRLAMMVSDGLRV